MIFNIKAEDNILKLSADKKKAKKGLIPVCIFFTVGAIMAIVEDYSGNWGGFFFLLYLFLSLLFFLFFWKIFRVAFFGEVLIFDLEKGEFSKNKKLQKKICEIAKIELHHYAGDDVDKTYLHIVYTDETFFILDEDSISDNEELTALGRLVAEFLKVPFSERQRHRKKSIFSFGE